MSGTRIQKRIENYRNLILKDAEYAKNDPKYQEVLNALTNLIRQTDVLYTKEPSGEYPRMEQEQYQSIMDSYTNIKNVCEEFLNDTVDLNGVKKSRSGLVQRLNMYVKKDLEYLDGIDHENLPSFPDAVKQARSRKVDLTGQKTTTVSGMMNQRIPLKNSKGVKGYFTAENTLDPDKDWAKVIDKFKNRFPESYQERLEEAKTDQELRAAFFDISRKEHGKEDSEKKEMVEQYADAWDLLFPDQDIDGAFKREDGLKDLFETFYQEVSKYSIRDMFQEMAGIQEKSRLDQRNCAMYAVADFLGSPGLIAKAVPMTIVKDGKTVHGTFMEHVEGLDMMKAKPKDLESEYVYYAMNKGDAKKQMADLQVIDYICGNTDRNYNNLIYQFKKDEENGTTVSIVGIDNDCSFGLENQQKYENTKLSDAKNLGVISSQKAAAVTKMDKNMLKLILSNCGLSEKEVDAAWTRVEKLQNVSVVS